MAELREKIREPAATGVAYGCERPLEGDITGGQRNITAVPKGGGPIEAVKVDNVCNNYLLILCIHARHIPEERIF